MEGLCELTNKRCPEGVTRDDNFYSSQRFKEHFALFSVDAC